MKTWKGNNSENLKLETTPLKKSAGKHIKLQRWSSFCRLTCTPASSPLFSLLCSWLRSWLRSQL